MRFEGAPFFTAGGDARRHAAHVREMIELVLFTEPGERVNRPDFGAGLLSLIFEPNGQELAAAVEVAAHRSIQRWLGDLVEVGALRVSTDDAQLRVDIEYRIRRDGSRTTETFLRRVER